MATRPLVAPSTAVPVRLVSLDVFRGLTMAGMVIVNNPGDWRSVYPPLLHAEWHGWTPTDLIFPFFLFIVGVSITMSRKTASWSGIVRRAAIIFGLGLFLTGFPYFELSTWRIPGVLQRIAICYLIAAALYRETRGDPRRQGILLAAIAGAVCLAYWMVMAFVPAPEGMAGDLTPEGNVGAWLDRSLMSGHLYRPSWDPEGLLSTVPAVATTLFGIVCGLWLASAERANRKVGGLIGAGILGIILGYAWDPVFPINKGLWTSSYVMFTAGAAAMLLGACYWSIDVMGWRSWTRPFVILGANAITLYVASGILGTLLGVIRVTADDGQRIVLGRYLYRSVFVPLAAPRNASLLFAVAHLAVMFALLAWMYRRRLFLRV